MFYRHIDIAAYVWAIASLLGGAPSAQETFPADTEEVAPVPSPETEDAGAGARVLDGDKIYLRGGHVMTGVQVIGQTGEFYEVEVVEGVEPLFIPRRNVLRIEWDDFNPKAQELRRLRNPEPAQPMALGGQVSPELMEKLNRSLTEEEIVYAQRDVVRSLNELTQRVDIALEVDPSIRQLPPIQRLWTVSVPPGTTMMQIVQDRLKEKFPDFVVRVDFEKLQLMTREVAEALDAAAESPEPEATTDELEPIEAPPSTGGETNL
jgi:hypothetical protein